MRYLHPILLAALLFADASVRSEQEVRKAKPAAIDDISPPESADPVSTAGNVSSPANVSSPGNVSMPANFTLDDLSAEAPPPQAPTLSWEERIRSVQITRAGTPHAVPVVPKSPDANPKPPAFRGVRVYAPYPPRPLSPLPDGWELATDKSLQPVPVEAALANGQAIRFKVVPALLRPKEKKGLIVRLPGECPPDQGELAAALAPTRQSLLDGVRELDRWIQQLDAALDAALPPPPEDLPPKDAPAGTAATR